MTPAARNDDTGGPEAPPRPRLWHTGGPVQQPLLDPSRCRRMRRRPARMGTSSSTRQGRPGGVMEGPGRGAAADPDAPAERRRRRQRVVAGGCRPARAH